MSSIINQILQSPAFKDSISSEVVSAVIGKQGSVFHGVEGRIEGAVTNFEIETLEFDEIDGSGLEWSVRFKGNGTANVQAKNSSAGEYVDADVDGPFDGSVEITFPENTLHEDLDAVLSELEIDVNVETVAVNSNE